MDLVIVESPTKVKTVEKYLGDQFKVVSSVGHIRDLPKFGMGVEPPTHKPIYEIYPEKEKTVGWIRKLAKSAGTVYLATDLDREGEAIAWHLQQVIGKHNFKRLRFNEITKSALQEAIRKPGELNYKTFLAQQGRRVVDRYAGYMTSAALAAKTKIIKTAGRVQTPAVCLIVEREIARETFVATEHFGVQALFKAKDSNWTADLDIKPLLGDDNNLLTDRSKAEAVSSFDGQIRVVSIDKKETRRNPPAPFTTSTMQQAASNRFKMSSKNAMRAAQTLYEAGLITYHRTDQPNLSDEAYEEIRRYCAKNDMTDYCVDSKRTWEVKDGAQEAHEAIRPTDFNLGKSATGNSDADNLYSLIWQVALCSQLKSALYDTTNVRLKTDGAIDEIGDAAQFKATGRVMKFDGWLTVLSGDPASEKKSDAKDQVLPALSVDELVKPDSIILQEKTTKPPARYTPASFVKELEALGIGRPSTYAETQEGILSRGYVALEKRHYVPTNLGRALYAIASESFCFANYEFTRDLEEQLDQIELGKARYEEVVDAFHSTLALEIQAFELSDLEIPELDNAEAEVSHPCPQEGCTGSLNRRKGQSGFFWGCSQHPDCSYTTPDVRGKPQPFYPCPNCSDGRLTKKKGNYGPFWGCNQYKQGCKTIVKDKRGKPDMKAKG